MPSPPDPPPTRPAPPRPGPARPVSPKRDFVAEEEAARRLTNAHIQFRRGLLTESEAAVKEILAAHPQDAAALELLGDVQAARGDLKLACASYQTALRTEPGRVSAESKLGRATLRQAEQQRQAKIGVAYAAEDTSLMRRSEGADGRRSAIWSALGSALCPGLGQIVSGHLVKGSLLLGSYALTLGLLALLAHGSGDRAGVPHLGPAFWLVALALTGIWLYAIADAALASTQTKRASSEKDGWQI